MLPCSVCADFELGLRYLCLAIAKGGISAGVRYRDAHGRRVNGRLAVECRDQPRGSSCPPCLRHLVVSAVNLPEVPFQDMGLRVQEGLVGGRTEDKGQKTKDEGW